MKEVFVGWPDDGGVLIAEFQNEIGEDKVPEDIGRLRMAFTTEKTAVVAPIPRANAVTAAKVNARFWRSARSEYPRS